MRVVATAVRRLWSDSFGLIAVLVPELDCPGGALPVGKDVTGAFSCLPFAEGNLNPLDLLPLPSLFAPFAAESGGSSVTRGLARVDEPAGVAECCLLLETGMFSCLGCVVEPPCMSVLKLTVDGLSTPGVDLNASLGKL